jgi:hypothetical protein
MTDLVPIHKGQATQVSLLDIQERLDARKQIAETRTGVSTRTGRVEEAKRVFAVDPLATMIEIKERADDLAEVFDGTITMETIPLNQTQINRLSAEFDQLERLKVQLAALEGRYRDLIFAHLDVTSPAIPGRPATHVPGKVEAEGPGPHYVFERRGGNRENPDLDTEGLRSALPPTVVAQLYKTVHHDAVAAWDEDVFDEARLNVLVKEGIIDLDVVALYLKPGKRRTPSFYKTRMDGSPA